MYKAGKFPTPVAAAEDLKAKVDEALAKEGVKKARRGIGVIAVQNKRRKTSNGNENVFEGGGGEGMQVDAEPLSSNLPQALPVESPVSLEQLWLEEELDVQDAQLLVMSKAEEVGEEKEEKELAKLIAECVLMLANILPEESGGGMESERERLYRIAKEEVVRGGFGDVVAEVC